MKFTPFRTALIYLFFALIWILTTDTLLEFFVSDVSLLIRLQIIKGWFYVILTAVALYFMMKSYEGYIKTREEKQKITEANLLVALNAANLGSWNYDVTEEKLFVSEKHQHLLGLKENEEATTKKVFDKIVEEDLDRVKNAVRDTILKGVGYEVEFRINRKGGIRWIRSIGTPVKNLGKVVRVHGVIMDITTEKIQREELKTDKQYLQKIYDSLPVFLNVIDGNMQIKDINRYITERLGYQMEDLLSDNILKQMVPESKSFEQALQLIKNADGSWQDFNIQAKNGEILNTSWTIIQMTEETYLGIGVDITERVELEKEIKGKEERLSLAVKGGNVGLWDWNYKTNELIISDEWAAQLGYCKEDLAADVSTWKMLTHPDDVEESLDLIDRHINGELEYYENEIRMRHKDGQWIWLMDRGEVAERDADGSVVKIMGAHIDITDRKNLEQEIKQSKELLEVATISGNLGLWDWNVKTGATIFNEVCASLVGYTLEELEPVSFETWNSLVHPEDFEKFQEATRRYFRGEVVFYELEVRMRHKEGHWVWILTRGGSVEKDADGKIVRMAGTHLDITTRKLLEQKIVESRERLEVATDSANVGLWEWYPKTGKIVTEKNWAKLIGYDLEELEPISIETWNNLVHPDDLDLFEKAVEDYFSGKVEMYECEVRMKHKNGHWVWILDRGKTVEWDEEGNSVRMTGTHVDISEQKENERLLKESQRVANLGTYVLNIETHVADTSRILDEIFGLSEDEKLTFSIWQNMIHPDYKYIISDYESAMKDGLSFEAEYKIVLQEGERWIYEKADVEKDEKGNPVLMIGIMQDISKVKEYEEKLEREKTLFKVTSDLVSNVVWDFDINENKIWWNEGIEQHFSFDREDIGNKLNFWTDHIHPDHLERVVKSFQNAIEGSDILWEEDYIFLAANGDERQVLDRGYIFRDENGKAIRMTGAILDLTEQKKAEELLQYQAGVLETISDAILSGDENFRLKSWNKAAETIFGYSKKEVIGRKTADVLKTEVPNGDINKVRDLIVEKGEWEGEIIQYTKSGQRVNILTSVQSRYNEKGEFIGTASVNRNITEIKKVQDKLAREQKRFEYAASVVSDAIWDADPNEGTVWWSEGFKTNFGYEVPSIEKGGTVWEDAIHPDDKERVLTAMKKAEEGPDTSWSEEYRFFRADGTIAYVLDQSFIMRDYDGNILRIIGSMNDITSEIVAKEELQRSEEHYRLLFEESPIPMWIYDPVTFRFESANNAAIKKYGYSMDEFVGMSIFDLHPESDQEAILNEAKENLKHHQSGFDEWIHVTKSGEQIIAEISGTYIYDGEDQKRLLIANDITRQRTAEKQALSAMVEGEERERARVANELHDGLGQYLSAANMNLKTVYEDIPDLSEKLRKPFKDGLSMLNHAITETRSISQNLLPKSIQDYGLELAVASLINDVKKIEGKQFTLQQYYNAEEVPQNIQINLFRIVQESLNNAIRHSNAKAIHLQLIRSENNLIYTIEDDGTGFNINKDKESGLGLQSMKTRVAAMAGYIDIDSKIDKGTMISVIIPLNK